MKQDKQMADYRIVPTALPPRRVPWQEILRNFLASGADCARLEVPCSARRAQSAALTVAKQHGLPVRAQVRGELVYLVRVTEET